ncbi:FUSC family protein [Clostridium sp.]|uniref:FUSC family protein n=1 Tax=Clostridium sp. TaxID=1506 RepID=UPI003F6667DA
MKRKEEDYYRIFYLIQMKKELILRNGGIFLLSLIFIYGSIHFLGRDNLMVGANAVFLLVGILNKNFSTRPIKSILKVICLMALIGILPFLVNFNNNVGLFINFIGIFILLYAVVYNLNKSIYYPFLFGYTLLLSSNVTGKALLYRVIGLIIVGIIAVLYQIIYTKIIYRTKMSSLKRSLDFLIRYVGDPDATNNTKNLEKFREVNAAWSRELLEYRGNNFYLNYKENLELNLIAVLDKLEKINSEIINKDIKYKILEDENLRKELLNILKDIRKFIYNELKEEELELSLRKYLKVYKNKENIYIFELAVTVETFKNLIVEFYKMERENLRVKKKVNWIDIKESIMIIKEDFNINSVRFIFSFRTAVLISVIYFIIQRYHIDYGKWIIFTIASVSQPYNETVKNRAKERILGTLIGAFIYYGLSLILVSEVERVIVILAAVYLYIHFKTYMKNVMMITIMFLGLATLNTLNTTDATEWRILFIIIGSIVVILGNKFIFPYNFKKETKVLLDKYIFCCNKAFLNIFNIYENKLERNKIKNLILQARGLENKIILNNTLAENKNIMYLIENERIIINCIQNIFNLSEYYDITLRVNGQVRMEAIKELVYNKLNGENLNLSDYLNKTNEIDEKLIYKDMYEVTIAKIKVNERIKEGVKLNG